MKHLVMSEWFITIVLSARGRRNFDSFGGLNTGIVLIVWVTEVVSTVLILWFCWLSKHRNLELMLLSWAHYWILQSVSNPSDDFGLDSFVYMLVTGLTLGISASFWVRYWLYRHALRWVGLELSAKWSIEICSLIASRQRTRHVFKNSRRPASQSKLGKV